ncbi:MAG: DNA polymerase I [Candidatus Tectomicrobia bacterium]|uniref:DNA polymerase I n=1 Tax=Tectimicrobiota bacterium TaxID=2528274 RepID=A0A932CPN6_UNCTE|nr:DNA polymerase I [Candidatus Tectomicrobia bacterium]
MVNGRPHLYLIDGSAYLYRAFFAIRQELSNSKGLPTNAIYGFVNMLLKILREEKPDYLAIAFDPKGSTVRHQAYAAYKAHRPPMPADLILQVPYVLQVIRVFNIALLQEDGYEADDLLGTVAREAERRGFMVTIVSGDKDMLQLVSSQVRVLDTVKGKVYQEKEVQERFGVEPAQVADVMGLMGDATDNIPGVPGIGPKTAAQLIQRFGSVEHLLEQMDQVEPKKLRESLKNHTEEARMSKALATIITDIPLEIDLERFRAREMDRQAAFALFKELEFSSLLKATCAVDSPSNDRHQVVVEAEEFRGLLLRLREARAFALSVGATHKDPLRAELLGVAFSLEEGEAYYLPLGTLPAASPCLPVEQVLASLRPILEDAGIGKYGHHLKYSLLVLASAGIQLHGIVCDTMIASYLLNPSRHSHGLDEVAVEHLGIQLSSYKEILGNHFQGLAPDLLEARRAAQYACQEADLVFRLARKLMPLLKESDLDPLFFQIELPLIQVLAEMERTGIRVDPEILRAMSKDLDVRLDQLMRQIYAVAGVEFNINSPKQLTEILFERLKLKPVKKTKTGYSTDVAVLQELALQHELPVLILNYRQLAKLKSTYVDALPQLIHPRTGRIHTSFNQAVTATGRLSSSEPNLQNLPVRTSLGREIRRAFVAEAGHLFISADYSQIELRILAHLSEDALLLEAFAGGEDVHAKTAAELFGVAPGAVTPEMRRLAKTVNFGIIYGLSPYGLARDLNIGQQAAKEFIDRYFSRHQGVKAYIQRTIQEAHERGYVTTLWGRRRYLPDLRSASKSVRDFAERIAINTPIQGSAADLIKVAMLRIHQEIQRKGRAARMTLQVHDELVFEVPEEELQEMVILVKEGMEGVISLRVPLVAEISISPNLGDTAPVSLEEGLGVRE